MSEFFKSFGDFVRNRRKQLQLTQDQLAEAVGVSQPTISEWERGVNLPDANRMAALAKALDMPVEHLHDALHGSVAGRDDEVVQAIWRQQRLTREEREALILMYKRVLAGSDQRR